MFSEYGFDKSFSRSSLLEFVKLKNSSTSKLISKLLDADIIENVVGQGKGVYKFKCD